MKTILTMLIPFAYGYVLIFGDARTQIVLGFANLIIFGMMTALYLIGLVLMLYRHWADTWR